MDMSFPGLTGIGMPNMAGSRGADMPLPRNSTMAKSKPSQKFLTPSPEIFVLIYIVLPPSDMVISPLFPVKGKRFLRQRPDTSLKTIGDSGVRTISMPGFIGMWEKKIILPRII